MSRFCVFLACLAMAILSANAFAAPYSCDAGYYLPANTTECALCPNRTEDDHRSGSSTTWLSWYCLGGEYEFNSTTAQGLTQCPLYYPNSDPGATQYSECYSDVKQRPWTGNFIQCDLPTGCASRECETKDTTDLACDYVAYAYGWWTDGDIKSGCETNNAPYKLKTVSVTPLDGYLATTDTQGNAFCTPEGGIECEPGYYLPADSATCTLCPSISYIDNGVSYYCPGGKYKFNSSTDQGLEYCPTNYPHSADGANAITKCYSDARERIWSDGDGKILDCDLPDGCDSRECESKNHAPDKCYYYVYSNADGTGDGEFAFGGGYNGCNENFYNDYQLKIVSVTPKTGYHIARDADGNLTCANDATTEYSCDPGYYLPAKYSKCLQCPIGYYCPGGTYKYSIEDDQGKIGCPYERKGWNVSGYPNSDIGASAVTECYSNIQSRPWTGEILDCELPAGCAGKTCEVAAKASTPDACDYVAYSNADGTGDGKTKSGCETNDAPYTLKTIYVIPLSGYYATQDADGNPMCVKDKCDKDTCTECAHGYYLPANATECTLCKRGHFCPGGTYKYGSEDKGLEQCPRVTYPNSDDGASAITECYSDAKQRTWTGKLLSCDVPDGCESSKCENTPPSCTYFVYSNADGTDDGRFKSGCTTNNADYKPAVVSVTPKTGYHVANDATGTLVCALDEYTVTFDANDGTGGPSTQPVQFDELMATLTTLPTRTDYAFIGYFDAKTDGTQYYSASGVATRRWDKTSDTTLYAHWSQDDIVACQVGKYYDGTSHVDCNTGYKFIQYCPGTGTAINGVAGCTVDCGDEYDTADIGASTIYGCAKYCEQACTQQTCPEHSTNCVHGTETTPGRIYYGSDTCNAVPSDCSLTFDCAVGYVKTADGTGCEQQQKYTVTFDANNGTGGPDKQTVASGTLMATLTLLPTRATYSFVGYFDAKTGGVQYYDADGTAVRKWDKTSDTTLYAHWSQDDIVACQVGKYYDGTSHVDCNTGYKFIQYCPGTGTAINGVAGCTVDCGDEYDTADIGASTIYGCAKYCEQACTQQTCPEHSTNCVHGTETTPGRIYYGSDTCNAVPSDCSLTFDCAVGYVKTADGTGCEQQQKYTVTFDANDGTGGPSAQTVTFGELMVTLTTLPTRTGYVFSGYFDAKTNGTQYYDADGTALRKWDKTSNTTLYAHWAQGDVVACQAGKYYDGANHITCQAGQFCDGTGSSAIGISGCTAKCPGNGTSGSGVTSVKDCFVECPTPGTIENGRLENVQTARYYDGATYPTCTYRAICDTGYKASNNYSTSPTCIWGGGTCPENYHCDPDPVACPDGGLSNAGDSAITQCYKLYDDYAGFQNGTASAICYYQTATEKYDYCQIRTVKTCKDGYWYQKPTAPDQPKCGAVQDGYWSADGALTQTACPRYTSGGAVHSEQNANAVQNCYKTDIVYTATHGGGTQTCDYDTTTSDYTANCRNKVITSCDAGYWLADSSAPTPDCHAVGSGYYSTNNTERAQCKSDGMTLTDTSASSADCYMDDLACDITNGSGTQTCNYDARGDAYTARCTTCTLMYCDEDKGFYQIGNTCIYGQQLCSVEHGTGIKEWDDTTGKWGDCEATSCDAGYTNDPGLSRDATQLCGECKNKYDDDGNQAVSSYVRECEIASCIYQGEMYNLENNECQPICSIDGYSDETGFLKWNASSKKCDRTCNVGYTAW